jgi:hypothetical protein
MHACVQGKVLELPLSATSESLVDCSWHAFPCPYSSDAASGDKIMYAARSVLNDNMALPESWCGSMPRHERVFVV